MSAGASRSARASRRSTPIEAPTHPGASARVKPPGLLARLWRRTRLQERRKPGNEYGPPRPPTGRELLPILAVMSVYLAGGLTLALTVNRGFYLNDLVALIVYTVVVGGLLFAMRHES